MNILSLFDGMSCGQIALKELGIKVSKYYASEIDKFAIKQTQHNFPDTVQLGSVEDWKAWDIDYKSINLILAGSPCQGFSFAGKQLAFDDPRSRLFFVFIDILNHVKNLNPDVKFLLENVDMKRSHMKVITDYCGVYPVNINSNLVSAQNRNRWYWTNVKTKEHPVFGDILADIPQPMDEGILLRDILEKDVNEKYYLSDSVLNRLSKANKNFTPRLDPDKTGTITQGNNSSKMSFDNGTTFISISGKSPTQRSYTGRSIDKKHNYQFIIIDKQGKPKKNQGKASCFTAGDHSGGNHSDMDLILQLGRGFNKGGLHQDKSPTITKNSFEQNNLVIQLNQSTESGGKQPYQQNRVYSDNGIMPAISAELGGRNNIYTNNIIRRLTPIECARLQTIPDWYEWVVSDTQIYKMCGNGWTVKVIMWILRFLKE